MLDRTLRSRRALTPNDVAVRYKLNLLSKESIVNDAIAELEASAAYLDRSPPESGEEAKVDEVAMEAARDAKTRLEELEQSKAENKGAYDPTQIMEWTKQRVLSMTCQNQGYVITNYPETDEQAMAVFAADENAENTEAPNPLTVPEFIFALDAPDEVLMKRAMELPPKDAPPGSEFSEEGMRAALPSFRKLNDEDAEREDGRNTVLNFFDFKEIHPTLVQVPLSSRSA